jgi:diguanylate cyclase (GGDEF)-like protein/PAS domain S-box-containing protein
MPSLRSAQSRATLAGVVLVILLASVATLAVWRVRDDQQRHHALEQTSAAATTLEHAQAQFWQSQATLAALILLGDPSLADSYHDVVASLEQNLSQARASALAEGKADEVSALDDLTGRISHYTEQVNTALPIVLEASTETRVMAAASTMSGMVSETEAIIADLEELVEAHDRDAIAATAAADRAANATLWLLTGFGTAAFLVAIGTIAMFIVSVVRPLAALRASARAITSGEPKARAKIAGPEEVASLARDFNEMTDALSKKTQEYIDTTNLTGDIIARLDKHGNWAFVNDAVCRFYGKPREELLGTDSRAFAHRDDLKSTAQRIRKTSAGKKLHKGFVNRQVTPMGIRVVEWNGCPLFDEKDQYAGIQITGRDITERKQLEEELRESEERFRSLSASAPIGVFLMDLRGDCVYANPRLQSISGLTLEESLGYGWSKVIHPDDQAAVLEASEKAAHDGRDFSHELRIVTPEGELRWIHVHTSPMFSAQGKQMGRVGTIEDITDSKQAEAALRESESKHRTLLENLPQKIFSKDPNSVYVSCNENYAQDLNIKPNEITGKTDYDFFPKELAEKYRADDKRIMQSDKTEDMEEAYVQDGQEVFVHTVKTPIRDGDDNVVGILGIFWDITECKRMEEERERLHAELQMRAITDSLTGLYNHAHFFQRLAEEINRSKRYGRGFAVVMMDIDKFKQFNDTRGHQAGDETLRLVAECIRAGLRRSDIPFRYGGDEFAAILLHADSSRAQTIAKRMNKCLTRRLQEANDPAAAWLGLSVGVACFPDDATTVDDLVKIADTALYDAKRVTHAHSAIEQAQATGPPATAKATAGNKG